MLKDTRFYVLSDDVTLARKILTNVNVNGTFDIVYPGNQDISSPGTIGKYVKRLIFIYIYIYYVLGVIRIYIGIFILFEAY